MSQRAEKIEVRLPEPILQEYKMGWSEAKIDEAVERIIGYAKKEARDG